MSNKTTNGYALTPKFWLWMAEQAKGEDERQQCLEMALTAAVKQEAGQ
jgi:hypothetical protein